MELEPDSIIIRPDSMEAESDYMALEPDSISVNPDSMEVNCGTNYAQNGSQGCHKSCALVNVAISCLTIWTVTANGVEHALNLFCYDHVMSIHSFSSYSYFSAPKTYARHCYPSP